MDESIVLSLPQLIASLKVANKTDDVKLKKVMLPGGDIIEGKELRSLMEN